MNVDNTFQEGGRRVSTTTFMRVENRKWYMCVSDASTTAVCAALGPEKQGRVLFVRLPHVQGTKGTWRLTLCCSYQDRKEQSPTFSKAMSGKILWGVIYGGGGGCTFGGAAHQPVQCARTNCELRWGKGNVQQQPLQNCRTQDCWLAGHHTVAAHKASLGLCITWTCR